MREQHRLEAFTAARMLAMIAAIATACGSPSRNQTTLATCGNGVLEPGETCDPPGSCPRSCSDDDACTTDGSTGSAANCNLSCTHRAISACVSGDGCCPVGCSASTDSDCSSTCGNGVLEPGETCDPPGSCPSSCSDGDACTTDGSTGSAASCNLSCTHQAISACVSGDGCCPAGCNASTDSDCACCVPARPTFVKLAEGTLTTGALASDPIHVGAYTEIMVYVSASLAGSAACPTLDPPQFRSDPALPFATTGRLIDVAGFRGGRLPVDGSELRLSMGNPAQFPGCTSVSYHYVVAGVQ